MILDRLLTLIANLLPLAGVLWWGWDVFEILILFWMQTVLVVVFTLLHVTKLPQSTLGDVTVNGVTRPATRRDILIGVSLAFLFCAGHLLFLWVIFSGHWSSVVHGPVSFVQHLVIANGAWLALAMNVLAGIVGYLLTPPRAVLIQRIGALVGLRAETKNREDLGVVVLALVKRIFLLQAAIIFGGMLANSYGSMAPLMILIGLKTLAELGGSHHPRAAIAVELKS